MNHLKLKVNDTYKNDEKITTNVEHSYEEDEVYKSCIDTEIFKIECHLSLIEKDYNQCILHNNKQSEVLIEKAVKTTVQLLFHEGLFHNYEKADEVLKI